MIETNRAYTARRCVAEVVLVLLLGAAALGTLTLVYQVVDLARHGSGYGGSGWWRIAAQAVVLLAIAATARALRRALERERQSPLKRGDDVVLDGNSIRLAREYESAYGNVRLSQQGAEPYSWQLVVATRDGRFERYLVDAAAGTVLEQLPDALILH